MPDLFGEIQISLKLVSRLNEQYFWIKQIKTQEKKHMSMRSIFHCFGTESTRPKTVLRACVVNYIVPMTLLWSVLLITLLAYIFSSGVAVLTQRRQLEVVEYPGWNDTSAYEFDRDELFWFIQITDTHLTSKIPRLYNRFEKWLSVNLPTINPKFVIHTGDIVDAMAEDEILSPICKSEQIPAQWKRYNHLLRKHLKHNFSPDYWIDIRGNHDNYDVPHIRSELNYYVNYSVSSMRSNPYARVWTHTHRTPKNSIYSFVAMDAAPPLGLSAPMNFYGMLTSEVIDGLKHDLPLAMKTSNHTFLMGHYPISTLNIHNHPFRNGRKYLEDEVLRNNRPTAYLSGHLHLAKITDANNFFLDLELADFMFQSYYRLLAVDNDLFSYVDLKMKQWPVVLVTNPKDAPSMSNNDKWQRMRRSTHIRTLVFSPNLITDVRVYIDGKLHTDMTNGVVTLGKVITDGTGLYQFEWDAEKYTTGKFHKLSVVAVDAAGNKNEHKIQFNLHGKAKPLGSIYSHIILSINMQACCAFLLTSFYLYCMLFCLILPKITYFLLTRVLNPKHYELFKARINKNIYKWVGAEDISNEDKPAYVEVKEAIDNGEESVLRLMNPSDYGTSEQSAASTADDDQIITVHENTHTVDLVEYSVADKLTYKQRIKKNWGDTQNTFWSWALQGAMWHTWRHMHMSHGWFITMLLVGLYLPVGPLFFGPIISTDWGQVYMWGIWVRETWWFNFGALVYGFPLILLIYIPTVSLCTAHNDFWRLRVKFHFQKVAIDNTMSSDSTPENKFSLRRAIADRYLFFRLRKSYTLITGVLLFGIGFMSYSHAKYYGADSFISSPGVFFLSILAIVRVLSEFTIAYIYFNKCRGKEERKFLIQ
jgi:hypothetical protein